MPVGAVAYPWSARLSVRLNICNNLLLLLLYQPYNSGRVLVFSTVSFHLSRSWTRSDHFTTFSFFRSFLTPSSHLDLGLPIGRFVIGCHLYIFFTMLDEYL